MEIEIRNWEKYNPKRDQKTYTWLRLDNDIARGPEFHGLKNLEKYVAILLLCEASKENKGRFWLDIEWFCDEVAKEPMDFVLATIDKLATKKKNGDSFILVHTNHEDPNQTTLLPVLEGGDNVLPCAPVRGSDATAELPPTTPTNERTDESTDGRSFFKKINFENLPTDERLVSKHSFILQGAS